MDEKYEKMISTKDFKRESLFRQQEKKTEKLKVSTKAWNPTVSKPSTAPQPTA